MANQEQHVVNDASSAVKNGPHARTVPSPNVIVRAISPGLSSKNHQAEPPFPSTEHITPNMGTTYLMPQVSSVTIRCFRWKVLPIRLLHHVLPWRECSSRRRPSRGVMPYGKPKMRTVQCLVLRAMPRPLMGICQLQRLQTLLLPPCSMSTHTSLMKGCWTH